MLIGPPFGQSAWTFRTTGSKLLRVIFDTNRTQIFTKREISKLYTQKSCWNASWCCVKCVSGSSWSHSLPIIHIKTNSKDSKRGRQTSNVTRIEADEGLINWRSERNQTFIRHQSHFISAISIDYSPVCCMTSVAIKNYFLDVIRRQMSQRYQYRTYVF